MTRSSLTLFAAALLAAPLVAQQPQQPLTHAEIVQRHVPGGLTGAEALAELGPRLAEIARLTGRDAAEVSAEFLRDDDLVLAPDGRLVFVDTMVAPAAAEAGGAEGGGETYGISTDQAFLLNSRPGASKTLYMDFTGHHSVNNSWGHNIVFPAYDTNGDPDNFSTAELEQIIRWWLYVVEDFAPFDINVTTEFPGTAALTRSGGGDQNFGVRCVITQATSGFGDGIGGVAQLWSFNDSIDNPVFAFNKGDNTGSMTVSHEVGHSMGLSHDGLNGQSYHPGTGGGSTSWGPIMGAPFGASLVQWSDGDYAGSTTTQNDLAIINGSISDIPYLPDDHGDGFGSGSPMAPAQGCPVPLPAQASGVIERDFDTDAFVYSHAGGPVTFEATRNDPGGNLDIRLQVFDGSGGLIADVNENAEADASVDLDLPPGNYTLVVDGVGKGSVYDDYGSLGQFLVSAYVGGAETIVKVGDGLAGGSGIVPIFNAGGLTCAGETISFTLGLAPPSSQAFLCVGVTEINAPFKGGVLIPNINPPGFFTMQPTNFLGGASLNAPWPAGLPSGFSLTFQYWIVDGTAPTGFAASKGIRVIQS